MMLDHIKSGADFMTTCLTTFRTGLPGGSSTRRTLYQFFRTKKHVLDAISRKKLYPFAWGNGGLYSTQWNYYHIMDTISHKKRFFACELSVSILFALFIYTYQNNLQ